MTASVGTTTQAKKSALCQRLHSAQTSTARLWTMITHKVNKVIHTKVAVLVVAVSLMLVNSGGRVLRHPGTPKQP